MEPKKKLTERDAYEIGKEAMGYMSDTYNLPVNIDSLRGQLASMGILLNVCPRCGSIKIESIKPRSPNNHSVKWRQVAPSYWNQSSKESRKRILRFKCPACEKEFEVREIV